MKPDGSTSCSPPELIGKCDAKCAKTKWAKFGNAAGEGEGPICDVPGCDNATD